MSVKCWEIILARASSHLRSAHTYVNWTFPLGSMCNSKSLPVLCRAVNQCNPGDACSSQLAGRITYNSKPLQHRAPMGRSHAKQAPPSVFLHLQGFDLTPFASLALKTFMYHISRGKGRCREKAILAYSKRHTRGLCVSTTEYSEASLCIYN